MSTFFVTGANGFVGSSIVNYLRLSDCSVVAISRNETDHLHSLTNDLFLSGQCCLNQFKRPFILIHCAGLAHLSSSKSRSACDAFLRVNVDLSLSFAEAAVTYQFQRFLFISSISVYGDVVDSACPIVESSPLKPSNYYAQSKLVAEYALQQKLKTTNCLLGVLRPTIIYGPGMPGNLQKLRRLLNVPFLPFAYYKNARSLLSVNNLADAVIVMSTFPDDSRFACVYNICDSETLSIGDLCSLIRLRFNYHSPLLVPSSSLISILLRVPFLAGVFSKLYGDYVVSSSLFCSSFNWKQPFLQKLDLFKSF